MFGSFLLGIIGRLLQIGSVLLALATMVGLGAVGPNQNAGATMIVMFGTAAILFGFGCYLCFVSRHTVRLRR